jgi:nicotinamidase-related amidase
MDSAAHQDLNGSAPDRCQVALLVIDMINDFEFENAEVLFPRALAAAKAIAALKQKARRSGVPVLYVNDNFGKWRSTFAPCSPTACTMECAAARSRRS